MYFKRLQANRTPAHRFIIENICSKSTFEFFSGEMKKKINNILTRTSFLLQFWNTFVFLGLTLDFVCVKWLACLHRPRIKSIWFDDPFGERKNWKNFRDSPRPLNFSAHLRNYLLYTINFVSSRQVIGELPLIDYVHSHCDLCTANPICEAAKFRGQSRKCNASMPQLADKCRREALRL